MESGDEPEHPNAHWPRKFLQARKGLLRCLARKCISVNPADNTLPCSTSPLGVSRGGRMLSTIAKPTPLSIFLQYLFRCVDQLRSHSHRRAPDSPLRAVPHHWTVDEGKSP